MEEDARSLASARQEKNKRQRTHLSLEEYRRKKEHQQETLGQNKANGSEGESSGVRERVERRRVILVETPEKSFTAADLDSFGTEAVNLGAGPSGNAMGIFRISGITEIRGAGGSGAMKEETAEEAAERARDVEANRKKTAEAVKKLKLLVEKGNIMVTEGRRARHQSREEMKHSRRILSELDDVEANDSGKKVVEELVAEVLEECAVGRSDRVENCDKVREGDDEDDVDELSTGQYEVEVTMNLPEEEYNM